MIEQDHRAQSSGVTLARLQGTAASPAPQPLVRVALMLIFAASLSGCGHRKLVVLPQIALAPIDLEVPPEPDNPPMIELPADAAVVVPSLPSRDIPRRRPVPPRETPPPPVQVASAPDPATLAIGALSSGGEATPQIQQQTKDLIASIRKRLSALSGKLASQRKDELSQVSRFLKQAQQALDSGDAEGAKNLATKARLLMDDVEKK